MPMRSVFRDPQIFTILAYVERESDLDRAVKTVGILHRFSALVQRIGACHKNKPNSVNSA